MKKPEKKERKKLVAMTATESYLASLGVSPRPMTLTVSGTAVRRYRTKIVS
jgi:hypothetical protein